MPIEISIGDVVRMRKPHPCGGYEWEVFRTGADIGMACRTCGRRVMLPRAKFEKRLKAVLSTSRRRPAFADPADPT
jgi:hypothetical protein